jgi:DNA modification methylase
VEVFREVYRVLRNDGTAWLNLGDSYARDAGKGQHKPGDSGKQSYIYDRGGGRASATLHLQSEARGSSDGKVGRADRAPLRNKASHLKAKDLVGIPWMVAFALRSDGWYLRQDIIWSKPNPMPESVTDRCTKAHEYLFLLSKRERYYYDSVAIAEPAATVGASWSFNSSYKTARALVGQSSGNERPGAPPVLQNALIHKRSVWAVASEPFSEAHFATFPPGLIKPCILAGSPGKCCAKCGAPWVREVEQDRWSGSGELRKGAWAQDEAGRPKGGGYTTTTIGFSPSCTCNARSARGTVLDPFGGAGTVGLVANQLNRDAILIDLNPEYGKMASRRIRRAEPLFAKVVTE